jgi:ribose transport system ATP-binding protein
MDGLRIAAELRRCKILGKELLLDCQHIYKSFGPTKALVNVDLKVYRGEVRGLIGENGSGKSTLSSIIAGSQLYDKGEMFFKEDPYKPASMLEGQKKGISMVVQESGTIPNLTVAANIFVGKENLFSKGLFINVKAMMAAARKILNKIGAGYINPAAEITTLSFEDRKIVEIARAMYDDPELLIVDETTTALPQKGRKIVYEIMKKMSEEGKAVLFISHDLDELISVCNDVTVLRDGVLVGTMKESEMEVSKIRESMVGREISGNFYRDDWDGSYDDEVVLKAENITCGELLENFSLELHKGEILGICGLSDCGMHDLGRAIFGIDKLATGKVTLKSGVKITNPTVAVANKIGYISKNRDTEAINLSDTIQNNIVLPSISKLEHCTYISREKERQFTNRLIESISIKCNSGNQLVSDLSGGNKQKVSFAKWIGNESDILVMDCPTRGVDIVVKAAMYELIYNLKKNNKSIIMISEELPELIGMCDRLLVIKDGVLTHEFKRDEKPQETDVIHYMI